MSSYKIIVARYNEDITWLRDEMINCIIYNKGEKLNIPNEFFLKNVGRESDTYLHYIIDNYDNLPDVVVFTQARISDHQGEDNINILLNMKNSAIHNRKSKNYITHNDQGDNVFWDHDFNLKNKWCLNKFTTDQYKDNKIILFKEWFITNVAANYPNPINIYPCAIFAVKKECITSRSLEYYKKLLTEGNYHNEPIEAHFFERSWYYIFN